VFLYVHDLTLNGMHFYMTIASVDFNCEAEAGAVSTFLNNNLTAVYIILLACISHFLKFCKVIHRN